MLFEFGRFWKMMAGLGAAWLSYGIFGYEFTAITLLWLLIVLNGKKY